jgi:hypothetical protein
MGSNRIKECKEHGNHKCARYHHADIAPIRWRRTHAHAVVTFSDGHFTARQNKGWEVNFETGLSVARVCKCIPTVIVAGKVQNYASVRFHP